MAGNQAVVEFLLKWSEQGGQLPEKVKRDLDRMGGSTRDAASITDRLGDAFGRLEKREPTMVLRRARTEVASLATSVIGARNPIAGLVTDFTLMAGGAAAFGTAIGSAGLVLSIRAMVSPMAEMTKAANTLHEALNKNATAVDRIALAMGNLRTGAEKTVAIWSSLSGAMQSFGLGSVADFFAGKALAGGAQAGRSLTADLQQQGAQFIAGKVQEVQQQYMTTGQRWSREAALLGLPPGIQREAERQGNLYDAGKELPPFTPPQYATVAPQLRSLRDQSREVLLRTTRLRAPPIGKIPFAEYDSEYYSQLNAGEGLQPHEPGADTGAILSAVLGLVGSARGGAGGVVSGLGGLANVALKNTPLLGQALSFGGGLLSLLGGGGPPHVIIKSLEEQAIRDMNRVMQIPNSVIVSILRANGRTDPQVRSDLTRLANRDALPTLPV